MTLFQYLRTLTAEKLALFIVKHCTNSMFILTDDVCISNTYDKVLRLLNKKYENGKM